MASCLVHVANLTVVARLRGAECRLPVFHTETQRNYQGNSLGVTLQKSFLITGKDCNPQPANCLKDQYVLRHCCVGDRSDKIGHSANVLF